MASDRSKNGDGPKARQDEGGLGNLPPLSDFDSSGGFPSDSLPPLASFESDKGHDADNDQRDSIGGLPPIGDIHVETPMPTGGNIKPSPPGYEVGQFESPAFATPIPEKKSKGGFQDLAADSDFSPETPEIGPGPDSDMDTPMFDSAFGGSPGGFTPSFETPAPTQAMETPMFGSQPKAQAGGAFDEGAFKSGGFDSGTPMPDFSPDTAFQPAQGQVAAPAKPVIPPKGQKPAKATKGGGGGSKGMLVTVAAAVICLIVGIFAGPNLSKKVSLIPNPYRTELAQVQDKADQLERTVAKLTPKPSEQQKVPTLDEINKLIDQQKELTGSIDQLKKQEGEAKGNLDKTAGQLEQVRADLEGKNEEFVKAQEAFEDLQNQTSIVQARQQGLVAEVKRLTELTGTLEEANTRTRSTKEALVASVDRMLAEVKEGLPLTPEKYSHEKRVAEVEALKTKVSDAKWVTADLLDEYTGLYQKELDIASSNAYFFAKIPVTNRLNEKEIKWAECLMKGNWAVYYRTLDGKNIGAYENTAEPGAPVRYAFREDLPDKVQKEIQDEVIASRVPDFEDKLKVIAEKQSILNGNTSQVQKIFGSL